MRNIASDTDFVEQQDRQAFRTSCVLLLVMLAATVPITIFARDSIVLAQLSGVLVGLLIAALFVSRRTLNHIGRQCDWRVKRWEDVFWVGEHYPEEKEENMKFFPPPVFHGTAEERALMDNWLALMGLTRMRLEEESEESKGLV